MDPQQVLHSNLEKKILTMGTWLREPAAIREVGFTHPIAISVANLGIKQLISSKEYRVDRRITDFRPSDCLRLGLHMRG